MANSSPGETCALTEEATMILEKNVLLAEVRKFLEEIEDGSCDREAMHTMLTNFRDLLGDIENKVTIGKPGKEQKKACEHSWQYAPVNGPRDNGERYEICTLCSLGR